MILALKMQMHMKKILNAIKKKKPDLISSACMVKMMSTSRSGSYLCIRDSHITFNSPSALSGKCNYTSTVTCTFLLTTSPAPGFLTCTRFHVPPAQRVTLLHQLTGTSREHAFCSLFVQPGTEKPCS